MRVRGGPGSGHRDGCLHVDGNELTLAGGGPSGAPASFCFDLCYGPHATQTEVYEDTGAQILDAAFEGYNGTIFAYGQTGSGKSHSIMGTPEQLGIVPRLAVALFERVASAGSDTGFEVTATYAEIYNEVICDLLTPGNTGLKIRQHVTSGIYVENLTEVQVSSHEEIEQLIAEGNKARQVAATRMNDRSSRSHAILTIMLRQAIKEADGSTRKLSAKVNLVDLAGSERADMTADAKQLQEGAAINKSLSALGNVINALAEGGGKESGGTPRKGKGPAPKAGAGGKGASGGSGGSGGGGSSGASYVPYRSSKLTRLLEESLGGNTVTVMLATVSADARNARETLATLKYAQRTKKIKNTKSKNEAKEEKRRIRELTAEIERLNSQLTHAASTRAELPTGGGASARGGGGGGSGGASARSGSEQGEEASAAAAAAAATMAEQAAALAELRMELERSRQEASNAAATSLAQAARADELEAELEVARATERDLSERLGRASVALTTHDAAQRSAELDGHRARQELQRERQAREDDRHRLASLDEENGVVRRQLQAALRHLADAKSDAAEAVAQRRAAERQQQAVEAERARMADELARSTEGLEQRREEADLDRRASAEFLGAASREATVQARLMDTNLAAFKTLLAQKEVSAHAMEQEWAQLPSPPPQTRAPPMRAPDAPPPPHAHQRRRCLLRHLTAPVAF